MQDGRNVDLDPQQCRVLLTAATIDTQANAPCAVQSLARLLSTFVPPIPPLVRPPFGWQRDPHVLTREISPEKQCHRRGGTRGTGTLRPTKIEEDGVRPVLTLTQHTELHLNVYYHIGGRVLLPSFMRFVGPSSAVMHWKNRTMTVPGTMEQAHGAGANK